MRGPMSDGAKRRVQRLAWFAALWLAGVAAVGALAWLVRVGIGVH